MDNIQDTDEEPKRFHDAAN